MAEWIGASWATLGWTAISMVGAYAAIVLFTRIGGLRSFAKISSFDFAATVAIGSALATTALTRSVSLAQGAVGLAVLYGLQSVVARGRRFSAVNSVVDNEPLLLVAGQEIIEENLRRGRITRDDLRSKLRESNVLDWSEVRAVVLETTGDISVLHGAPDGTALDPDLLQGVRGVERLARA